MADTEMPTKLLWMDLEMSGLDYTKQRILEVAVIVTDFNLEEIERYEATIHQDDQVLENAEQWPREHMQKLFEDVRVSRNSEDEVAEAIKDIITRNFGQERAVLAGNSIHNDRKFITHWWPQVEELLHYRMFDVSTLKIWVQGTANKQFEKSENHRAIADIEESIAELRWALEKIRDKK